MSNFFEIAGLIVAFLTLGGAILSVYVSMRIAIARIEVQMKNFDKELLNKELAICHLEKDNKEDHKEILIRIDKIYDNVKK